MNTRKFISKQCTEIALAAGISVGVGFAAPASAQFTYNGDTGPAYWPELNSD